MRPFDIDNRQFTLTCTLAALNPPTVMSLPHRTSPSQSMCCVWHGSVLEQQDVDSGGIGLIVPSPMTLFFHKLSLLMITDIWRRIYTRRRGLVFGAFLDATVLWESTDMTRSRRTDSEKRSLSVHPYPESWMWKGIVSVRPYIRPAGTNNYRSEA